jgi:hypothetical protein
LLICCFETRRRFDSVQAFGDGCKGGGGIEDSALERIAVLCERLDAVLCAELAQRG